MFRAVSYFQTYNYHQRLRLNYDPEVVRGAKPRLLHNYLLSIGTHHLI